MDPGNKWRVITTIQWQSDEAGSGADIVYKNYVHLIAINCLVVIKCL